MCGFCKKKYRKNNHVKIVSLFLSHYLHLVFVDNNTLNDSLLREEEENNLPQMKKLFFYMFG